MFSLSKKQRPFVQKYNNLFSEEDNMAWETWVDSCDQSLESLQDLLNDPSINAKFKARALFGIVWLTRNSKRKLKLDSLSQELLLLARDIVLDEWDILAKSSEKSSKDLDMLDTYAEYFYDLLQQLPEKETREIVARYPLEYPNGDGGYTMDMFFPFRVAIGNPKIPLSIRRTLDAKMQALIIEEQKTGRKISQSENDSLERYFHIIYMQIAYEAVDTYDIALLACQTEFILSNMNSQVAKQLNFWELVSFFEALQDDKYQPVKVKLARFAMRDLYPLERSFVFNGVTHHLAEMMLTVLSQARDDTSILEEEIRNYKKSLREYRQQHQPEEEKKKEKKNKMTQALNKMRQQ